MEITLIDKFGSFTVSLMKHWYEQGHNVNRVLRFTPELVAGSDLIWQEWADENAIALSQKRYSAKVICRLHKYEVRTYYPSQVQWENIDDLIFVSKYFMGKARKKFPTLVQTRCHHIPNGVDLEKFTFRPSSSGNIIGLASIIHPGKSQPSLVLEFARRHPELEFRVAGRWTDKQAKKKWEREKSSNVTWYGWQKNMPEFLQGLNYLLSDKPMESFGYTVAEAMATGVKPLIYDGEGVRETWPDDLIWSNLDELDILLEGPYEPERYRAYIEDNYSLDKFLTAVDGLVAHVHPKVSVCLITWNESDLIESAIESIKGLADEIVVADTGSTDDTVEKARSLGAVVVEGADRMHKGESRNKALDIANGDWEIILDADERIADPVGLREFLLSTDRNAVYVRPTYMTGGMSFSQLRCWRRGLFRYKYRAHEVPVYTLNGNCPTAWTQFIWEHRPPSDRLGWKKEYTLNRLELDLKENPDDSRVLYYYARQLRYLSKWKEALKYLHRYLKLTRTTGNWDRANAYQEVAVCQYNLGNQKDRIRALFSACAETPMNRSPWCVLASIYYDKKQNELAAGLLRCALEIPKEKTIGYLEPKWHGQWIHDLLARCYWHLGRYEKGIEQARIALALEPNNERLKNNLGFFERRQMKNGMA